MIQTIPLNRVLCARALVLLLSAGVLPVASAQIPGGPFGSFGSSSFGNTGPTPGAGAAAAATNTSVNGAIGTSNGGGIPGAAEAAQRNFGNQLDSGANSLNRSGSGSDAADSAISRDLSRRTAGSEQRPKSRPQNPSQFQQFVQQATGRLLPIYGQELFERPEIYVADQNGPVAEDYVLGPGDEIKVQVWGGINYDGTLTIDRNGQVTIPRAGVVNLAGVRAKDTESALRTQLGSTFTNFNLNANVDRLRTIQVYVVGQAQQPGTYNLSSLSTLVNALFASGGPTANGSMRNIQLKRGAQIVTTLDLYDFIGKGDKSADVALKPGDVIVIPPAGPRVALTGALDQAAIYELKNADKGPTALRDLLGLNGGVPVLATTSKALVERVIPNRNPPRLVQDLALDATGLSQPLADGDVITLLNISPAFANVVTLQGNVAAPLRYKWFPGMRIRDLIPERDALITADYYQRKNMLVQNVAAVEQTKDAGNNITQRVRSIVDQINWDYAAIERLDKDKLRTQLIPFNLAGAVMRSDESQNLTLEAGDVVTIFSEKDLRLPLERQNRLVRVEGEVAAPGVYEAMPGETLVQLVQRIGGLRPQAYVFGTDVSRISVREKQQENLELLIRRLEQQQQSQMLYLAANRPNDSASQAALFQQQQQAGRAQIEALRNLKSTGRIGLELNPESNALAALPDLPLEDGDRILIPSMPGFVSAIGAVNNENVYVYRAGRTVDDVIQSAGLREEADKDRMFILRADGSIVSKENRGGLFGNSFAGMKMMPGDTLFVPEKLDRETTRNFVMRQVKDWTQILSQFGLGVAAIKVIKDL